jgi:Flp pilus assembly protein TadD
MLTALCAANTHATAAETPSTCTLVVARIVSVEGSVEVRRSGQANWSAVTRLDTPMCQGDLLHAGARSRAAVVILPEKFVRLDQNSTISIDISGEETIVEFFQDETTPKDSCGAGYFITRFPRKFKVRTPLLNAAVEGTEFSVSMSCSATALAVFEGKVSAETLLANAQQFILNSGQTLTAGPGEPPAIKVLIRPVDAVQWALYYPPLSEAGAGVGPDQPCDQPAPDEKSRCLMVRAEQRLRVGRVDEAQADIEASLKLVSDNSDAEALLSVISVAKNEKQKALALAQNGTQLDAVNPRAWIALSYAQQASFRLEDALTSAQRAAELNSRSSIALTRVAELMMSLGRIRSAQRAAQAAVDANPTDSRAHTILGFVNLARIDIKRARADFEAAIALDSGDPLPRLGLGIAIIRSGRLVEGREQIEIAVALDPTNSLLRSYVGKAYYEENTKPRDKLAATQFGLAKQLDPKDPTPWFYSAILEQTQNRPVDALQSLQRSVQLNDNKAVYRSRLGLDEDLASRTAAEARFYNDLGFSQVAVTDATQSLLSDPTNFSAHRFLSDAYATQRRQEIARRSELLQSQLLQPLNSTPLQAQLVNDQLTPLKTLGPNDLSYGGLSPLFLQNGLGIQLYGLAGDRNTWGDQVVLTGLSDRISFSASQFYRTFDGFRTNDFEQESNYDAFVQVMINPELSLQGEISREDSNVGDLLLRFDPENFRRANTTLLADTSRVGGRLRLAPASDLIFNWTYQDREESIEFPRGNPLLTAHSKSQKPEVQFLTRGEPGSLIAGLSYFESDTVEDFFGESHPIHFNSYLYTYVPLWRGMTTLTVGASFDHLRSPDAGDQEQFNPKLGAVIQATPTTILRLAYFRVLKRRIVSDQGLEPTQVAGFNQFYDDFNGTDSRFAGIAVDQRVGSNLYVGLEATRRNLSVPLTNLDGSIEFDAWQERAEGAYAYWTPARWCALIASVRHEIFRRPIGDVGEEEFTLADTVYVPLSAQVFIGPTWSALLSATYVNQNGQFLDSTGTLFAGADRFWIVDAQLTAKLPRRRGTVAVGVKNLFDTKFQFQSTDPGALPFALRRYVFATFSLAF